MNFIPTDCAVKHSINRIIWRFTCEFIKKKNHINAINVVYHLWRRAIWGGIWRATIISNHINAPFAIAHSYYLVICKITSDHSIRTNGHSPVMYVVTPFHGANYFDSINNCTAKNDSNANTVIKYFHNRPVDAAMRFVFTMLQTNRLLLNSCDNITATQ